MKKSLFALAAVGAFAGAAQAQSSVTVYGILDLGYGVANARSSNPNTINAQTGASTQVNTNVATVNSNFSQIGQSYESTSRLGFRGTEDLGGGLSAFFTVETALSPNGQTGAFGGTSSTANRQSFVGLAKKGLGKFAVGTQYTVIHSAASATDPGQLNNMMGNVIYDKAGPVTTTANGSAASTAAQTYAGNQDNTSYTVRANNMLTINTDSFGGFQGNAFYTFTGNTTNPTAVTSAQSGYSAGGISDNSGYGLGLNFNWQKLLVTANYQSFTSKSAYTMTNSNGQMASATGVPSVGFAGGGVLFGTNVKDSQQYYAATYDFGILKAYVQYVARKVQPSFAGYVIPDTLNRTAQQIGVRGYVTKTVETWANVGNGSVTYYDTNKANIFGYQLGANYWLSKRTNLYAIYGAQSTSNAQITIGATPVNPNSYNASAGAVGVRHTF